jgi:hypothetical protein
MEWTYLICTTFVVALIALNVYMFQHNQVCEQFAPQRKSKWVIISLTSSPRRLQYIGPTLDSILNQTYTPLKIILNIPHVFKRTGESYDLDMISEYTSKRNITINRCEDLGPLTKVYDTLLKYQRSLDTPIIYVDDDTVYSKHMVDVYLQYSMLNPDAVISGQCTDLYSKKTQVRQSNSCDLVEGFGGVLVKPSFFDKDFYDDYIPYVLSDIHCYRGDDYVLSNYFWLKGRTRLFVVDKRVVINQLSYGFQSDALHRQDTSMMARYKHCETHLGKVGKNAMKVKGKARSTV